ncbi:MAG: 50S ribosomal protein L6 [Candidatus Chaera renei]|uniref:Large ribosomal subunit protein uL6 n=1 Tax=Candidatus Chaera renei TaxID=2506947 RepID=A0A4Q0AJG0_9BACT|nr:MAG: 50S ribosomal protein L6 [Candidatus Chaera renei]
MSRIGKLPIVLPASGVTATLDGRRLMVSGPKGELTLHLPDKVKLLQQDGRLVVERLSDADEARAQHGLVRSLVNNMVIGVSQGFSRQLEINGIGYRVSGGGQQIELQIGLSHPVVYKAPAGVTLAVDKNVITVSGIDKQLVGQTAAEIRALKKPEPYKGKGIKYVGEQILRKAGKTGK